MGYLYYATTLPKPNKFGPRVTKLVLLGYVTTQKGYKLYDLEHHIFFIGRDMVFNKDILFF